MTENHAEYADHIVGLSRTVALLKDPPPPVRLSEFEPVIRFSKNADPASLVLDRPNPRVAVRVSKEYDDWALLSAGASERYLALPVEGRNGYDPADDDIELLLSSHEEARRAIRESAQFMTKMLKAMLQDATSSRDLSLAYSLRAKLILESLVALAEGESVTLPENEFEVGGLL